jgi:hypothetical protein
MLRDIKLNVVVLSVIYAKCPTTGIMLSIIKLNVVMPGVNMLIVIYAMCHLC